MARNFNGGTDRIHWFDSADMINVQYETIAFWFRTTQVGNNIHIASLIDSGSRQGWLVLLSSGMIYCIGYAAIAQRLNFNSGTTLNDGNWHHFAWQCRRAGGFSGNILYIDGVSVATTTPSGDWYSYANIYTCIGKSFDNFWGSYIGDIAEFSHWRNTWLTSSEIAALAKGFSPQLVHPRTLDLYAPLIRDPRSITSPSRASPIGIVSTTGTTVVDHPRVYA